jgi:REP element-mobilizing transposase RayT
MPTSDSPPPHQGRLEIRHGANLPHWRRDGATYAVNFRLADSLPAEVLERWRIERDHIIANAQSLARNPSPHELRRLRELHSERVEAWLDSGYGSCILREDRFAQLVRDAILHFDGDRYAIYAWCVMPNHAHAVLRVNPDVDVSRVVGSWKGFAGKRIREMLDTRGEGEIWQKEPYDHLIRDAEDLHNQIRYVLNNPVKAGLRDWPWAGTGSAFAASKSSTP